MMNEVEPRRSLEEVLDDYVAEVQTPSHAVLMEWIRRYPEYEQALIDFTGAWSTLELWSNSDQPAEPARAPQPALPEPVRSILAERRAERDAALARRQPLTSLIREAQHLSMTLEQFVDHLELSVALVRKLESRLIRYATIPLQLIERLAQALRREAISVARYLDRPATLPAGAQFRADAPPAVLEQEDFYDAVRNDRELDAIRRERWLALQQREG